MSVLPSEQLYSLRSASLTFGVDYNLLLIATKVGSLPYVTGGLSKQSPRLVTEASLKAWLDTMPAEFHGRT